MKKLYLSLTTLLILAGCQSIEVDVQAPVPESPTKELREVIITASISDAQQATRTSYNEDESKNYWSPGDRIKIFSDGESSMFTSLNTVPETMVKFKGLISFVTGTSNEDENSKDYVWGLYPYSEEASYSEPDGISRTARITTTFPAVQTGVGGTFGDNLSVMIGRSESMSIPFRGAYSGAFFQVSRNDIISMTLKGLNNEVLAGKATIGLDDGLVPVVYNVEEGKTEVTVTAPGGTFEPGVNYYLITLPDVPLPDGYSVTLRRSDGYEGTYELRANRPLNRIRFRNLSEPVDVRIENATNIANGISTGWVLSTTPDVNEVWYTTNDGEAVHYTAQSNTGNQIVQIIAPKNNNGKGVVRFAAPVTVIDENAMADEGNLVSVSLSDAVEHIGVSAFEQSANLSSVHFGSSLQTIGRWAFSITNLSTIDLPEGLKKIGAFAFDSTPLTSVTIPESVEFLGYYEGFGIPFGNPFWECNDLQEFRGKWATNDGRALVFTLNGRRYLVSITPGEVGDSYTLPEVEEISFMSCSLTRMGHFVLPQSLQVIRDGAFYYCTNLTSVTIPSGVHFVGRDAFSNCGKLEWARIESTIVPDTETGSHYYRGAPFYSSTCPIYVPESLIDDYQAATLWSNHADRYEPFPTTNKILYTTTDGQAAQYTLPDAYSSYAANISNTAPSSNTEDPGVGVLTFPFDLTEIPAGLFKDCRNLKTVHIPWDVQTIGNEAFRGCDALEAAYVRNTTNLTSLGARSFQNCYKLTTVGSSEGSVNLPMVSTVGEYAFYNALKVSEAHFPKLVTAGNFSFDNMGTSTTLRVIDVPKLENCGGLYTFGNITIDNLYLPSIKTLGRFSFGYSKIGTIHFGPNLLSMNSYCFTDSPEMTRSLYFEGTNPPTFQPYTFFIDYNVNTVLLPLEAIHVPSGCKVAYQNALHNASASYDAYFSIIVDDL